jgi:hypothetical protein
MSPVGNKSSVIGNQIIKWVFVAQEEAGSQKIR